MTTPAGHQGITFVAATGDDGAPGGYPAYSPSVLAAGGSTLMLGSSGNYIGETGWSGSGGGISQFENQPAFQKGIVTQSTTQRTIPDVSYDADPETGVAVYDSFNGGAATPWEEVGGTSYACPSWAALIAIADQGRALEDLPTLDGPSQTLPKIYSLPSSDFHDITSGNNGFAAGPGYDLVTGRGSPVANSVVAALVGTAVSMGPDVAELRGDSGITPFVFTVSLAGITSEPVTVDYTTVDGTAKSPSDYLSQTGTLTFTPGGPTTLTITIDVIGKAVVEPDETFQVEITQATNASPGRSQAVGTILNDLVGVSINNISAIQGLSGTSQAVFTVSIFGVSHVAGSIDFATSDGTATAFDDYLPTNGTIALPMGVSSATITVTILGESLNESIQDFFVTLSNPVHAIVYNSVGDCSVINAAPQPSIYINDVHVTTNAGGTLTAVFTVALDIPSGQDVTVDFATADGTAQAGINYVATSGTITFLPEATSQLLTVTVLGDTVYTPNEDFFLNLSNPVHAKIVDPQGVCTIIDAAPPPAQYIIDDSDPGFSDTGAGWTNSTNTLAYQLEYDYHAAGTGADTATWTFANIPTGSYQVFAHWVPFMNWASNAPYTILDGTTAEGTVAVNQRMCAYGRSIQRRHVAKSGNVPNRDRHLSSATGGQRQRVRDRRCHPHRAQWHPHAGAADGRGGPRCLDS